MTKLTCISFLSQVEKITQKAYEGPPIKTGIRGNQYREESIMTPLTSFIISRLAAALLSPAAALDMCVHTFFLLPTFIYCIGTSIYHREVDFTLPWQHLQKVQNAVAPLILGSLFGILHPLTGIAVSEPSDKHIALGILSSHQKKPFETPCSPIHSLSIIEAIASSHQSSDEEVFPPEYLQIIRETRGFEESLESLQVQEWLYKITNTTSRVLSRLIEEIDNCYLSSFTEETLKRLSGLLALVLAPIDFSTALLFQAFFLSVGVIRLISGRGPIYTEITTNPLMHISFLIQNVLKTVGQLLGAIVWLFSPEIGFKVSLIPAKLFFQAQMGILLLRIRLKLHFASEEQRVVIPIGYNINSEGAYSLPFKHMHKTYLIVEKKNSTYNLYWVDRPKVLFKEGLDSRETLAQINLMLKARFPSITREKITDFSFEEHPKFLNARGFTTITGQGNLTNCVVSNFFGAVEVLDKLQGKDKTTTLKRNQIVRSALIKKYDFYDGNFLPFRLFPFSTQVTKTRSKIWQRLLLANSDPI